MTAAKNVYALMLALVIVLSGCFGNTANDTDAQTPDDTTGSTDSGPEMIALGGIHDYVCCGDGNGDIEGVAINTTAGQMLQIHQGQVDSGSLIVETTCTNGAEFSGDGDNYADMPYFISGSAFNCTHELRMGGDWSNTASWSFVYSIVPVTVG